MGITNTVATISGFVGPTIVGAFTQGNVCCYIFAFAIACTLVYMARWTREDEDHQRLDMI